ncbi:MAG: glucosyl transferase [Ignavibacterium sp.]|nr:glucosyl transferase [Ignavibacterium sp.]
MVRFKEYSIRVFFLLLLCTTSCNKVDPPPDLTVLTLKLEDVSCTEAWITLTTNNLQLPATFNLLIDNNVTKTINLQSADTLLYIDSLLPNQTYNFKLSGIGNPASGINSNELSVTTLDTTSHNFTWQTFTFGEHSNSILRDVAIIDENNMWAVGEIRIADTSSVGYTLYNAAQWDGNEWNLHRIMFYTVCGQQHQNAYQASSVFLLPENEICIAMKGDQIAKIENGIHTKTLCLPWLFSLNKIWGKSSDDIYTIATNGNIAKYQTGTWSQMQSGTTVDLLDIWGSPDGTVWACGYNSEDAFTSLLRYDGTQWNKVYEGSPNNQNNNEYIGPIVGVWTNSNFFTYVTNWAFIYTQPNNNTLDIKRITPWFSDVAFAMRGTDHNNIFIAGQDGLVGHYNGVTYTEFNELKENAKNYLGVAVKDNIAVAVGVKYGGLSSQAVISIGRR